MKYVNQVIEDGERVIYAARVHWWVYIYAIVWTLIMVGMALWGQGREVPGAYIVAAILGWLLLTPFLALAAMITRRTTELVITDRRVIAKTGWIRRNTSEINLTKVEGVRVDQSALGRLLGFGTITVTGIGQGTAPIKAIDNPLAFRRHVPT